MKKKGLAVIYDPHNLYQFVWYYCNKGKRKEWDALCLPNGYKGEYMHGYCEASGIFQNIYTDDQDFAQVSLLSKIWLFTKMTAYYVVGRRKAYCRKLLNQYVDLNEYDELVVIADVGIVSGACVALAKEYEVIILEDGINDYGERPRFIAKNKLTSFYAWQGFFLSKMGYCSPGWFRFKADQECIKYCSYPEKMIYKGYKECRLLYSNEGTDEGLFNKIIKRIYPQIGKYNFCDYDTIILTRPLEDFVDDQSQYIKRLESYVCGKYSSALVKKHPREEYIYDFNNATEIDSSIPAEAILSYLKDKTVIVVMSSSILMYFKSFNIKCDIILFKGLFEDSQKSNALGKAPSISETKEFVKNFCAGSYDFIEI